MVHGTQESNAKLNAALDAHQIQRGNPVYEIRKDGFCGIESVGMGGLVVTKGICLLADDLTFNIRANAGSARFGIMDISGNYVKGFEPDNCVPFEYDDSVCVKPQWKGHSLAEVLDRVMDVTGIRWHKEHIPALPGITELDNCMVNAYFDKTKIKHENGVYSAEFECYEKELFDMVEIHLMQEGDTITIEDDQVIEIKKIEKNGNNGHIVINGGVDFEDGLVLAPGDGGTYFVFGLDDCPSYHFIGKKELELAKDVALTDTADIENKCVEKKVEGDEAVVKHLQENAYIDPPARGCMICIDGGKVVEVRISYVP